MNISLLSWSALGPATVSFCEARLDGAVAEPANAWSSMAYVAIGLALLVRAVSGSRPVLVLVAVTGLLIGAGSFALHATASFVGQFLDEASMFLLSALAVTLALRRLLGWSPVACVKCYVGLSGASIALLAVVRTSGIPMFALHMAVAIGLEVELWRRGAEGVRYGALRAVLGIFAIASVLWCLDSTRMACSAERSHDFNGHVVWHALTAVCLLVYYRFQEQFCATPGTSGATSTATNPIEDHILVVSDRQDVLDTVAGDLRASYTGRFDVETAASVEEATATLERLLRRGHRIPLVISDQAGEPGQPTGHQGTDLLAVVTRLSPKTKKGILTRGHDGRAPVDFMFRTPWTRNRQENLGKVDRMLGDYFEAAAVESRFIHGDSVFVTKEIDSSSELEEAFKLRFRTYLQEMRYKVLEDLTTEQRDRQQEWDIYDFQPWTRHVVTMRLHADTMECVGYARLITGTCPMEGEVKDGELTGFSLDGERGAGIVPVRNQLFAPDTVPFTVSSVL